MGRKIIKAPTQLVRPDIVGNQGSHDNQEKMENEQKHSFKMINIMANWLYTSYASKV